MPGPFKKRPHRRLQTLLNLMKREREKLNRSLDELDREDPVIRSPKEFILTADFDESPHAARPATGDSPENGLVHEDE